MNKTFRLIRKLFFIFLNVNCASIEQLNNILQKTLKKTRQDL